MYNFLRGVLRNTHGFVINSDNILNQTDDHNFEKYKHISIWHIKKLAILKYLYFNLFKWHHLKGTISYFKQI